MVAFLGSCATALPVEPVADTTPVIEEEPVVAEEIVEEESDEFVVSQEIYEKTFEDVELLIQELNEIIRGENFEAWRSFLSDEYAGYYSDAKVLQDISAELKKKYRYDLRLRSLKDYFIYIVVGSRQEANLEKIEFIDENHLLAYSIVNETPVILYYLARQEDGWKIAKWQ